MMMRSLLSFGIGVLWLALRSARTMLPFGMATLGAIGIAEAAGDEALYAALHPYYVEYCAVSQIQKKPGFGVEISGGPGGHSVLYLNGACRDKAAHYPTVKICPDGPSVGKQGVGLSVNGHFKNANWVVTEGRDFFFHGNLKPRDHLTREAYKRTQATAEKMGILDGVVFNADVFDDMPHGMSRRDYMYEVSVATDYAIGLGRDRYCARIPMDRGKMVEIVNFLNGLNDQYKDGKKDFDSSVLRNNCAHMTHNALTAVGMWKEWSTDQFILFAAVNFPVPKNEFVNMMERTNDLPLENLADLYADSAARQTLMERNWLPTEPGGLAETEPVIQNNDIYETKLKLIFFEDPIFEPYQKQFDRIFTEPRYVDIRKNLVYFSSLYQKIEAERKPVTDYFTPAPKGAPTPPLDKADFTAFYDKFYQYIE
ncbi:MAG: hypothetical protein JO255_20325, partial [Alphaproteobacteria bacterium]|nr:hypothetical protein [Alphaproteobacteria bacterium]